MRRILIVLTVLLTFAVPAYALQMEDVVRVTPLEVMEKIDRGEQPLIIDLRSRGAYDHSDIRIKGDMRIAPDELEGKLYQLPMAREIITYCT